MYRAALLLAGAVTTTAGAQEMGNAHPYLVTFGSDAVRQEGDHDFSQLLRFSVPADAGRVYVRVFDADTGGAHDEMQGSAGTNVRFSLYGDGAQTRLWRDDDGVVQETVIGEALGAMEFGADKEADDRWLTLFAADAESGSEEAGGRRGFIVAVEGLAGNDGNVFDIAVSSEDGSNRAPDGLSLYTYMPTFQVPRGREMAELRLELPEGASSLAVENFDAAGGRLAFAGRFRSQAIAASGKSEWKRETIALEPGEAGGIASLTAANGSEIPNDLTLFAGIADNGADPAGQPVAITLPIRAFPPNRRPETALSITPLACRQTGFDASGSTDPDGGDLSFRWRLGADGDWLEGATVTADFDSDGVKQGRLEVFDASGLVGNGRASEFSFFVKPKPVAALEAPALVAEGAAFTLDATGSTSPALPNGNRIAHYRFDMGDGTVIEQAAGEAGFGMPSHTYRKHGTYTVTLTVTDAAGHPCNTDTKTAEINVNAPPVANAGRNRRITTGEIHAFDARLSHDPDGTIVSYLWDFGDGTNSAAPVIDHAYHYPGTYTVRLTVLDDSAFESGKGIDTIFVTVEDAPNQRPVANVGGDRTVEAGAPLRFDGTGSIDEDGEILHYSWDFGDGTGSDLPVVEHTYWEPGIYAVSLSVDDDSASANGQSVDSAIITVIPAENRQPVATFPAEFSVNTFRPLRLDASAASDRDGSVVLYAWDFGDGTTGMGPVVEHLYAAPGTYQGRLTLADNGLPEPQTVSFDFAVIVADKPNQGPTATIEAPAEVIAGDEVVFDAARSSDPGGSILGYTWDLGDGNRSSGIKARHVYQFPGTYRVSLTVADDGPVEPLSAQDSVEITVRPRPNQPPVADAGQSMTATRGEILRFDGSASADPDGNILDYAWDFGDGGRSSEARPQHAFHDSGTFTVRLTVTDDGDTPLSADDSVTVIVSDGEVEDGAK
ncbi:PKD domain-containing protein [Nitratireductor mangrovi]|uniref:PKD domain-containing protein n=1 Tax=Nitratireductor mangrovi TaxID=2599600 RepID=A0A6H0DYQ2_9HYPH|nr:PKD domain-containing protein [Nitratireductor mangrovi]QIS94692.1 PKD domain-containing protein [Nitratireductor mangrovi]